MFSFYCVLGCFRKILMGLFTNTPVNQDQQDLVWAAKFLVLYTVSARLSIGLSIGYVYIIEKLLFIPCRIRYNIT